MPDSRRTAAGVVWCKHGSVWARGRATSVDSQDGRGLLRKVSSSCMTLLSAPSLGGKGRGWRGACLGNGEKNGGPGVCAVRGQERRRVFVRAVQQCGCLAEFYAVGSPTRFGQIFVTARLGTGSSL